MLLKPDSYPKYNPVGPTGAATYPMFDIRGIREKPVAYAQEVGRQVVHWIRAAGTVLFYFPQYTDVNRRYRQMMTEFYRQSFEEKRPCAYPQLHFQTGWTYSGVERAVFEGTAIVDPKERYFYTAYAYPPQETAYAPYLYFQKVVPVNLSGWQQAADDWIEAVEEVNAEFAHVLDFGLGWEVGTTQHYCRSAPHLAASTYTRFTRDFCMPGEYPARPHWDMNLYSFHIASDFPGLHARTGYGFWAPVDVPPDCFGMQPAIQLFYRTGGFIPYTLHLVCLDERGRGRINAGIESGEPVDRTVNQYFRHGCPDDLLEPVDVPAWGIAVSDEVREKFSPVRAGSLDMKILQDLGLGAYKEDAAAQKLIAEAVFFSEMV